MVGTALGVVATGSTDVPFTVLFLGCVAAGTILGTASGLIPGLHANNFALLLAAFAPGLAIDPLLVGTIVITAGVVHTFLDIVPALALGVPDASMAIAALPGHRLVLAGRGREALRLSAIGSALAVAIAVPLSFPITWVMVRAYPTLMNHLPIVLGLVVAFLVLTEPSRLTAIVGLLAFLTSGVLGALTLDVSPAAPLGSGEMLTPLLTGLFGAPILIDAIDGRGVPPQGSATITMPKRDLGFVASAGSIAGAIVGYLPGVSAAIASVIALPAVPTRDVDRGFVVVTSGANTANAVFALFALVAIGAPRTGVMVAVDRIGTPLVLSILLSAVALAAIAGAVAVVTIGDRYLQVVGRMDYARISIAVLGLLVLLSYLFSGWFGVLVFAVATLVGLIPPRFSAKRVHLMGVLIGPLMM